MVIGTLLLCKQIGRLPIISYIGRYSIIPLGVHCILIYYISGIVPTFPQSSLAVFVLTVAISICLIPVFIKYFPYFTAQKDFDINAIRQKNLSNHQILHRLSLIVRIKRSVHAAERLFFTPSCYICQKCLILHRLNLVCKINKLLLCCFQ